MTGRGWETDWLFLEVNTKKQTLLRRGPYDRLRSSCALGEVFGLTPKSDIYIAHPQVVGIVAHAWLRFRRLRLGVSNPTLLKGEKYAMEASFANAVCFPLGMQTARYHEVVECPEQAALTRRVGLVSGIYQKSVPYGWPQKRAAPIR